MLGDDEIRKRLETERARVFQDATRTAEGLHAFEGVVQSEHEESGQQENLIRVLDRMDGRFRVEIEAIDRAIVRLKTGRYGRCQVCGQEIAADRLAAIPWTEVCLECARLREAGGPSG